MYDQFYGLTGRPFQLTPDPQYYFESGTHRKALSYLGYGLAQGEGFIVITGEVGAGKSTLVAHLMQTVDRARLNAATIVTSQLDGTDLVQMVAESFGISTHGQGKAETLKAIENHLHAEARAGRRCLLIVDEAQNLSIDAVEELRMLSNFQLGSQALLQIFLLGQPEFRDMVHNEPGLEQLRQRIIATHHLEAMNADEVEPYILHRLTRAGWQGNPAFTEEAFSVLYAETQAVPRKLNMLMNRVMLMGAVEQLSVIDGNLVKAVIADMAGRPFEYDAPMSAKASPSSPAVTNENDNASGELNPVADHAPMAEIEPIAQEPAADVPAAVAPPQTDDAAEEAPMANPPAADELPLNHVYLDAMAARITALESRVHEQDDALRRVVGMMIDWMDQESTTDARLRNVSRAA